MKRGRGAALPLWALVFGLAAKCVGTVSPFSWGLEPEPEPPEDENIPYHMRELLRANMEQIRLLESGDLGGPLN